MPVSTPATYEELARLIGLPLLRPELTVAQVIEGLELARRLGLASVTVRPCDIDVAVRILGSAAVAPRAAASFPHGSSSTAVKLYEVRDLLRRGARQIEMVIAVSKLLSREFPYVQTELLQAAEACHQQDARLTVVLEAAYLTDELKIIACRCAERAEVDTVKTSTGFASSGASLEDVRLLRKYLPEETVIEAAAEIDTLDRLLEFHQAGCMRFSSSAAAAILEEWKARLAAAAATPPPTAGPSL